MPIRSRHRIEPWSQDGRRVLSASRTQVAVAANPADARRIVALANSMASISTRALEHGLVRDLVEACAGADDLDLETVHRWLVAVRSSTAGRRRRGKSGRRSRATEWPRSISRMAGLVQSGMGASTASDAVRKVLEAVALASESDLRAVQKWLLAARRKP